MSYFDNLLFFLWKIFVLDILESRFSVFNVHVFLATAYLKMYTPDYIKNKVCVAHHHISVLTTDKFIPSIIIIVIIEYLEICCFSCCHGKVNPKDKKMIKNILKLNTNNIL